MRVIGTILRLFFVIGIVGGALLNPYYAYCNEPDEEPGIYCYDYFFSGNGATGISLFNKVNPNASFMDEEDRVQYKIEDKCKLYADSDKGQVSLFNLYLQDITGVDYSTDSSRLLPDPGVMFIGDENIDFKKFSSGDTVLYGGVLPFVALPDADLETEDSFFNEESFSLFLYFKTKF